MFLLKDAVMLHSFTLRQQLQAARQGFYNILVLFSHFGFIKSFQSQQFRNKKSDFNKMCRIN